MLGGVTAAVAGNAHTHTCLCDGEDTPAALAQAACQLGFSYLGFSGHSFCPAEQFGMAPAALAQYRREVLALKEQYQGRLAIYLGLELDSMSPAPQAEFDYLIGSVHNLAGPQGQVWPVDASLAAAGEAAAALGGGEAYARAYLAAVEEMLTQRPPTIAGHFDLLCKFNGEGRLFDEAAPEYQKMAAGVVRRHCRRVVFEINTGGMCRGWLRRPYPDYWLWQVLREEKAPVIVNSDAHRAADLAWGLAEQTQRARAYGLRVVTLPEVLGCTSLK